MLLVTGRERNRSQRNIDLLDFGRRQPFLLAGRFGAEDGREVMSPKPVRKKNREESAKPAAPAPARLQTDTTIVAIGASAGGIEAVRELMTYLQADTGMAFVLVQHLDPTHHSILTELLARKTAMPVAEVSDGVTVQPNHV